MPCRRSQIRRYCKSAVVQEHHRRLAVTQHLNTDDQKISSIAFPASEQFDHLSEIVFDIFHESNTYTVIRPRIRDSTTAPPATTGHLEEPSDFGVTVREGMVRSCLGAMKNR